MDSTNTPAAKWKPLNRIDRRVLGVLIEKAKTTPDQYPLSVNAIVNGCNQKSNRHPLMELDDGDVIDSIDRLRMMGAMAEVQGSGRVPRYRHYAGEWFGVTGAKVAIMAELLLRGSQTEGDLRVRVSRMDEIEQLHTLRTMLGELQAANLIVSLTPEGRGHMVTHNLYEPRELEKERAQFGVVSAQASGSDVNDSDESESAVVYRNAPPAPSHTSITPHVTSGPGNAAPTQSHAPSASAANLPSPALAVIVQELEQLRTEVKELRNTVDELTERCDKNEKELQALQASLGG
jgi:uncharacterized protein YceH (UPF0502 family)